MYLVRRTLNDTVSYYKYDGWTEVEPPLDLSGCVLFTEAEAKRMYLPSGYELIWYGSYKR